MFRKPGILLSLVMVMPIASATPIAALAQVRTPVIQAAHEGRWRSAEITRPFNLPTSGGPWEAVSPGQPTVSQAPLSLVDLEQMALANNPAVGQAAARLSAARGNWIQVGLPPNPRVGYMAAEIGDDGRAGQQGAFVSQRIVRGGKLSLNRAVASQEIARLEQQFAVARQRVLTDVQTAFYEVLAAQVSLDVAHELARIGNEGVQTATQLLDAKEVSRADVLQAQIELALAENVRIRAENRHRAAWRNLAAVIGNTDLPAVRLSGKLDAHVGQLEWQSALERLLTQSPQIAAAWSQVERARVALRRAIVEPTPDVTIQGGAQYDNATNFTIATAQVGLPLPLWNRNQGRIRQARSELVAAQQEVARLELGLQQRLAVAFEQFDSAHRQLSQFRDVILPQAAESLELWRIGYAEGEFGYVNLLTAQRINSQTNLDYIDVLLELRRSAAMIEGLLLDGSLREER